MAETETGIRAEGAEAGVETKAEARAGVEAKAEARARAETGAEAGAGGINQLIKDH